MTVNVVDPLIVPEAALITVCPVPTALASPVVLMVATLGVAELQVTEFVKLAVLPFVNCPVAMNGCVFPTAIEGLAGVTVIDFSPLTLPVPVRFRTVGLPKAPKLIVSVPVPVPTTVGVKVTPTVHFNPAPTLEPQVLLAIEKSPLATIVEIVRDVLRWLVSVTVSAVLVDPTLRLANVRLVGVIATGAEPVPVRLTDCGLFDALSAKVSVPVSVPTASGENVTPTTHFPLLLMLPPHVLLAMAKSPVGAMLVNVSAGPLFVSVTVFAALVLPANTVPKLKLVRESVTGSTPVPLRLTDASRLFDASLMFTAPGTVPAIVGVKYTLILQEWPLAILPAQVSVSVKGPLGAITTA